MEIESTARTLQEFSATLAVSPVAYNGVEPFSPVYQTDALTPVLIGSIGMGIGTCPRISALKVRYSVSLNYTHKKRAGF